MGHTETGFRLNVRSMGSLVGTLLLTFLPIQSVLAQASTDPLSLRRIQSVVPLSGPPGTRVRIFTEDLPLQARVHVGVGAVGAGFEVLGEASQGEWGEVSATVRLPASTRWDEAVVLIVFNAIFSPIAISEPFHVTNPEGLIRRTGRVISVGEDCTFFQDEDGFSYSLIGPLGSVEEGNEVVWEGRYVEGETGPCGRGSRVDLVRIERSGS